MSLLKREEEEEEIDCDDDYDDENLFSVSGKVVMITGGAKGIGKMITESFVKRKANKVIICGRNAKDLERVSKELNVAHEEGACDWIAADLSTEDGCESLCVEFKKRYIELDVLVNNAVSYDSSKAALHHLSLKLADELAPRNITVNVLALGFFPTKMTDSLDVYGKDLKEEITKNRLLIKRVGRPSDVAGAAIYLASEAASWVTGVVLKVDGGFLSKL